MPQHALQLPLEGQHSNLCKHLFGLFWSHRPGLASSSAIRMFPFGISTIYDMNMMFYMLHILIVRSESHKFAACGHTNGGLSDVFPFLHTLVSSWQCFEIGFRSALKDSCFASLQLYVKLVLRLKSSEINLSKWKRRDPINAWSSLGHPQATRF